MRVLSTEPSRAGVRFMSGAASYFAALSLVVSSILVPAAAVRAQDKNSGPATAVQSPQAEICTTSSITINTAGAANPFPAPLAVSGQTGTITDLNVKLVNFSHTYPDDVAMLLVSPDGRKFILQSDAGGGTDVLNLTYTFDDQASTAIGDEGPMPANNGSVRPTSVPFIDPNNPNTPDTDGMPAPAPPPPYQQPAPTGTATLNGTFNGISPNGTWNLFVFDFFNGDGGSISGGYCLNFTTFSPPSNDAPLDVNGDGKTDYVVTRNLQGGPSGQLRWYFAYRDGDPAYSTDWGVGSDIPISEDFDGDGRDDTAVYRPGTSTSPGVFYVVMSATQTLFSEQFGAEGDDPEVVGDYTGDGKADLAVYRRGVNPTDQSYWFYRSIGSAPGVNSIPWGQGTDFPAPGDYDGDGKNDFVVQREDANGVNGRFYKRMASGAQSSEMFGLKNDTIVPGDYDGDGKTDIAVTRDDNGFIRWDFEPSGTAGTTVVTDVWGVTSTDYLAQGDYNGDGKTEYAIYRRGNPGQFFMMTVGTHLITSSLFWGVTNDFPVANFNSH